MGVKNIANIMGESMDPCRTPCFIGIWTNDIELLILMEIVYRLKVSFIKVSFIREEYLLVIYFVISLL